MKRINSTSEISMEQLLEYQKTNPQIRIYYNKQK